MVLGVVSLAGCFNFASAQTATTCGAAGSAGANNNQANWQSICWIDFASLSTTAISDGGSQNFVVNLTDGSQLSFTVSSSTVSSSPNSVAWAAVTAPSYGTAAIGGSSYTSIPGKPVIYYTANIGTPSTLSISSIVLKDPQGANSNSFQFVVADGETTQVLNATASPETWKATTNGGNWAIFDKVANSNGIDPNATSTNFSFTQVGPYVSLSGQSLTETGVSSVAAGSYIYTTKAPSSVTFNTVSPTPGRHGIMLGVQVAVVNLNKQISPARSSPADQFSYTLQGLKATNTATQTTSGTATTGTMASLSQLSGVNANAVNLSEVMAAGSASPLSAYSSTYTCTNVNGGPTTVLPTGATGTSFKLSPVPGDVISCVFTNSPNVGSINITKNISGATSSRALDFPFTVTCTAPTSATYSGTVTVAANSSTGAATINNVPAGTSGCTVAEGTLPAAPLGYNWGTPSYTQPTGTLTKGGSLSAVITNPLTTPPPFASCPAEAFVSRGASATTIDLYSLNLATGNMTNLGGSSTNANQPGDINGIGFRQQDGYIYGWSNTLRRLVKMGSNGVAVPYAAAPTTLTGVTLPTDLRVADIQPSTGYYVATDGNNLYFIDVTTNKLVKAVALSVPAALSSSTDLAFNPGDNNIYSINSTTGKLLRIDPTSGVVTTLDVVVQNADGSTDNATTKLPTNEAGVVTGGYGAIFFDSKGTLYAYKSGSGSANGYLYQVYNVTSAAPSYNPLYTVLSASNLDGARCPAPPPSGNLQVNKALSPATATSTSPMTFNFSVTCVAPAGTYGGSVSVPANLGSGSVTLNTIPLGSAGCKITETTPSPAPPSGYSWGTPTYSQPSGFILVTPAAVGTITNPLISAPSLSFTKTADSAYIRVVPDANNSASLTLSPAQLVYTLTVSNSGGTAASGVVVTDTLPSGLTYVAGSTTVGGAAVPDPSSAGTPPTLTFAPITVPAKAGTTNGSTVIQFKVNVTLPTANTNLAAYQNTAGIQGTNQTAAYTTNTIYTRLFKQVRNVTQNGSFGSSSSAYPKEVLEYCIDFYNYGSTNLGSYVVTDNVPGSDTAKVDAYGSGQSIKVTRSVPPAAPTTTYLNTLTTTGGAGSGVATANLSNLLAGETGTMCFQATVK